MQTGDRNTDSHSAPHLYRNRPHSLAFNSPRSEPLCDVVYLVDEDNQLRQELCECFGTLGTKVIAFGCATEYLDFAGKETAACLVLNTHLPDISGFELQRRLTQKANPPVIFVSGHFDIASTVHAMKAGAIEFLTKQINLQALVDAVQADVDLRQRHNMQRLSESLLSISR